MIEGRVVLECGEELGTATDKSMAGSQQGTRDYGKGQSELNTITLQSTHSQRTVGPQLSCAMQSEISQATKMEYLLTLPVESFKGMNQILLLLCFFATL